MLETVERDRSLPLHRFFVVRMALYVFVARVVAARGSELLASGWRFALTGRDPANARAELVRIVNGNAVGYGTDLFRLGLFGVNQMDV